MSSKRKVTAQAKASLTKRPKSAAPKKPRRPKGMVEVSEGTLLTDLVKKQWKLGKLIGWGGFGALYLASSDTGKPVGDDAEYVIKIEPHSNGPLFTELAFYQRVAKPDNIKSWMKSHKLKHLGVPMYQGSGLVEHGGAKLRFMVMQRFGQDVDEIFLQHGRQFDIKTVLSLGIRIIDILEYIHENEYVHADIKGSNLMMGYTKANKDQVYLLDYGLTMRFNPNGQHKEYKEDPKRKHDGTVEFTSRDAHKGAVPSRRSDLEILGYVMLQWLCGQLPWEDNLNDKEYVKNQKIKFMDNVPKLMKECLPSGNCPEIQQLLEYVNTLDYDTVPDYNKLRQTFQNGLKKRKSSDDGKSVIYSLPSVTSDTNGTHREASPKKKATSRRKPKMSESSDEEEPVQVKKVRSRAPPKVAKKTVVLSDSSDEEEPVKPSRSSTVQTSQEGRWYNTKEGHPCCSYITKEGHSRPYSR
ncbi:hypothetical protein QZH41_020630 [Actinostola sp. cb2023]|nr:hypothetical protein QZH41_020630 [Actinostola sp. cb2023]